MADRLTSQTSFRSLAELDAALKRGAEIRKAKTPEQVEREFIAGQFKMARGFITAARRERSFRADLAKYNVTALPFYTDRTPALLAQAARHRRAAHWGRSRLAALLAQSSPSPNLGKAA